MAYDYITISRIQSLASAIRYYTNTSGSLTIQQMYSVFQNNMHENASIINIKNIRNTNEITGYENIISLPTATFSYCSNLSVATFPNCTYINSYAFSSCTNLSTASFPVCSYISNYAFYYCYNLVSLYLNSVSSVTKLSNSYAFYSTPIAGYSDSAGRYGSIYVPASLLTAFKSATNWVYFSDRMVGV